MLSLLEQQFFYHISSQPDSTEWKINFQTGQNPRKNAVGMNQYKQLYETGGKERDFQDVAIASCIDSKMISVTIEAGSHSTQRF